MARCEIRVKIYNIQLPNVNTLIEKMGNDTRFKEPRNPIFPKNRISPDERTLSLF
jgi:hypothetical protein